MSAVIQVQTTNRINEIFDAQRENQYAVAGATARERKAKIKRLQRAVEQDFREEIRAAMKADFNKPQAEVDLVEIFPITTECKHARRHLSSWMAPQYVSTPLAFIGSSSKIVYEPKGLCLIISPWNFPVNLTFGPLVAAIAAGNTAVIKPSEHTPRASAVIKKIVGSVFPENEVAVIEGGTETATALLALPFNHIFFTGAPEIGKVVMAAAAKNLASVTLELGGKSPTIVDETANIASAAKRIAWGKFANAGQVCIAPDYVFVHESKKEQLVCAVKKNLDEFYGDNPADSDSYPRVVNQKHTLRLIGYLEDALARGAKALHGGGVDESRNLLEPTVLENVPFDADIMTNEIFGPLLPVYSYTNLEEVLLRIRTGEKPLALYVYSSSQKNIDRIMADTRAGGTCINNNDIHFFNPNLPFGGVNNSGIGKGHGRFGFEAFSNPRAVYRQHLPSALEFLMPPYNKMKEKLIELTIKWF
jgi:aldehyde dehydrogenase (NAD+)